MVSWYCRRGAWVQLTRWTVVTSVLFLVTWTYRSWVMHGVNYLSSPVYRECQGRRNQLYSAQVVKNNDATHRPTLYVTMADHGRLGNWMFQYASLLGIAEANGLTPYFLQEHSLSYDFQLTNVRLDPVDCLILVDDPKPMSYTEKMMTGLPESSNITLNGYFQSWKYFKTKSISDRIRREFRFDYNVERVIRKNFADYVGRYVKAGREIISIHVRRGDTIEPRAQRLGFKPAPAEYFANAMRYMVKRHPFSVFLVVSDDIEWCRLNILPVTLKYYENENYNGKQRDLGRRDVVGSVDTDGKIVVVNVHTGQEEPLHPDAKNIGKMIETIRVSNQISQDNVYNNHAVNRNVNNRNDDSFDRNAHNDDINGDNNADDSVRHRTPPIVIAPINTGVYHMGLLMLANHSIVSVGSFGWWGAWLAGGDVVYYDNWPERDHNIYYEFTKEDYFPPHWVPVSGGSRVAGVVVSRLVLAWVVAYLCLFFFS